MSILISILMMGIAVIGDYYVKKSSMHSGFSGWKLLLIGAALYGVSAIGWFYVYRMTKVFTVGAINSFGAIIFTVILSVIIFKEKINNWEVLGTVLGMLSLMILFKNGK